MPWPPTADFPQPVAKVSSSKPAGSANKLSYTFVEMMTCSVTNRFRQESLGLPEVSQAAATTAIHRLNTPCTYCCRAPEAGYIDIAGFYFLPLGGKYQPDADLADFLAAGPPSVYVSFGSIVDDDPDAMTGLIFEAVATTGQRDLVSKGWGELGGDKLGKPDNVFMLGNCPHDWLFSRVSCVFRHRGVGTTGAGTTAAGTTAAGTTAAGTTGVGTTAAGIALGHPTVIVPFFGDQPFWGAMVARAGAASFHAQVNVKRIRCILSPSRPAVLQVNTKGPKSEGARLSEFTATVLCDVGLLDINELKLYRSFQHEIEDVTGNAAMGNADPILSTVGAVAIIVFRLPLNYGKALGGVVSEPVKGARDGGWRGFGRGMGKGLETYSSHAKVLKKRFGDQKLGFVLATHFARSFEDMQNITEGDRQDFLRHWADIPIEMKSDGHKKG